MKIDKESSERLNLVRFPLIAGVVLGHAYWTEVSVASGVLGVTEPGWTSNYIRNLISEGICRVTVPLFFILAGYFFFLGFQWSLEKYGTKLRARFYSLLVPFLFWNLLTLALFAIAQSIPATRILFSGDHTFIRDFGVYDYFNTIFGIEKNPAAYQFWFIRDLMLMVLFSPVYYFMLKMAPKFFLAVTIALFYFYAWPFRHPDGTALAFFYMGGYFATQNISLFKFDRYGPLMILVYLPIVFIDAATKNLPISPYIHQAGVLLGTFVALYLTKFALQHEKSKSFLMRAATASFFVYAAHEPFLTTMKKVLYKIITPTTDFTIILLYFANPIFVIIACTTAFVVLQKLFPKFVMVISGGR